MGNYWEARYVTYALPFLLTNETCSDTVRDTSWGGSVVVVVGMTNSEASIKHVLLRNYT